MRMLLEPYLNAVVPRSPASAMAVALTYGPKALILVDPAAATPFLVPFGKGISRNRNRARAVQAMWGVQKPEKLELEPITSETHFDQILSELQQSNKAAVIDWMATWCRKCIYLKPKLEKLAADFHPNFKFYCVDVNAVPKALVERGEVTKMPTIQLWRNGEKKAEVIGSHKAWLVMDEITNMIRRN